MNKKGFTLIELVAVILILGIIALIAIPAVNNVINDSKKHAAEVTAMSYIKSIDDQNALYKLQPDKFTPIQSGNVDDLIVNIKGDGPTSGTVTVTNGKVTEAEFCITGYNATYNGKKVTIGTKCGESSSTPAVVFNGTYEAPNSTDTHKGIVYLNPNNLNIECNASNSQIGDAEANESGCMRFYIFNDEDENLYKMILDHNIVAVTVWNSEGTTTIKEAKTSLESATNRWQGSPRLISADEIAHIVGADMEDAIEFDSSKTFYSNGATNDCASWFYLDGSGDHYYTNPGWQKKNLDTNGISKYAWLYNYTDGCSGAYNCSIPSTIYTLGYWTSSATVYSQPYIYVVNKEGEVGVANATTNNRYGIRPVIELPKSLFE